MLQVAACNANAVSAHHTARVHTSAFRFRTNSRLNSAASRRLLLHAFVPNAHISRHQITSSSVSAISTCMASLTSAIASRFRPAGKYTLFFYVYTCVPLVLMCCQYAQSSAASGFSTTVMQIVCIAFSACSTIMHFTFYSHYNTAQSTQPLSTR